MKHHIILFSLILQPLVNVTGFYNLRTANMINIIQNPSLVSIDGLSGLQRVTSTVRIFINQNLCYIGTGTPDQAYWQVRIATHTKS